MENCGCFGNADPRREIRRLMAFKYACEDATITSVLADLVVRKRINYPSYSRYFKPTIPSHASSTVGEVLQPDGDFAQGVDSCGDGRDGIL